MKPIDLTENNQTITPEQVATPVGCGGTCGGKCGTKSTDSQGGPAGTCCGKRGGGCCCRRFIRCVLPLLIAAALGWVACALWCGLK